MMATAPATKIGQREQVDPPHPEHGRQLAGQEQVGRQGAAHQGQADDVVDLTVVDGRLRTRSGRARTAAKARAMAGTRLMYASGVSSPAFWRRVESE